MDDERAEKARATEDGFDFGGRFYPWHVSDVGKDLMLIDRFSGLAITDFFDLVDDDHERGRGPILLTLIATSIRHGNPSWSVERITRLVMELSLSDVVFVTPAEEEAAEPPIPPQKPKLDVVPSTSPSSASSPLSTPEEDSGSATSYATPV